PGRAARGDAPTRRGEQANVLAAAGGVPRPRRRTGVRGRVVKATIGSGAPGLFPRFLDLAYPKVEQGEGVWLTTTGGERILDACSGGAMVTCLGHGVPELVGAATEQAQRIPSLHTPHFTGEPQERLADRILEVVAPEMARVRLVSGGS